MNQKSQHFIIPTLLSALAVLLLMSGSAAPLYAQSVDGTLVDVGQGDTRVLTTNWQTINAGQTVTYQFDYTGGGEPISISMSSLPAGAANFQVWTTERLDDLQSNPDTEPLGQGTPPSGDPGLTSWQGGGPIAEPYFVVVNPTGDAAATYLLSISSPGLAATQPGAVTSAAVTTTVPATTTTPVDPNIATVTTDALNVRSGPSTAFPVLTTVPNGTQMTVLGRNPSNTWLNVRLDDGTEGWVTRSLTNYTLVSANVVTPPLLPVAASVAAGLVATGTTPITGTAAATTTGAISPTTAVSVTELGGNWQNLNLGDTQWFSFQYRGGNLPLTLWMDLEPFGQAQFTVVTAETFQSIMNGTASTPVSVVGSGLTNPVQPGYLFWQADFAEADTYYVMVAPTTSAAGNVLYSLNALGPGVARGVVAVP